MGRGNFTKTEMETLLRNPYVADVNEKSISYQSNNKKIASVNKKGTIKSNKKGTASIRVTVTLNNGKTKVLKLKVKVK